MAIPPIIANNPLLKLFRTDKPGGEDEVKDAGGAASTPEDIVEISEAARQRLDGGIHALSADDLGEVQEVAGETRAILEDTDLSLGLDPEFS